MKRIIIITILSSLCSPVIFADEMPNEVKRMTILRDKKIEEVEQKYWVELDKLKQRYARAGNTKDALYIEKMQIKHFDEVAEKKRQDIEEDSAQAKISSKLKFSRFRNGTKLVQGYVAFYSDVPEKYEGWMVSTVDHKTTDPIEFKVKEAGIVSVVAHLEMSKKLSSENWKKVGTLTFNNKHGLAIMEKYLEVGEYSFDQPMSQFLLKK